jgi:trehalose 6-phosphate phosphatase
MQTPEIDRSCALFLDVDGTLIEIAEAPDLVTVPQDLPVILARLRRQLGGAIAIVSGRAIKDIDRLLSPFVAPSAGEHGAAIRMPDGSMQEVPCEVAVPQDWKATLERETKKWPGVMLEEKAHGVTIHYRGAPMRSDDVWALARSLVSETNTWFRLLPARMAVEIGIKSTNKGNAVEALMAREPFQSRKPIYVGDDFTDEAGISAAARLGGQGLRVGEFFAGDPAAVRAWLRRGAEKLEGEKLEAHP